MAEGGTATTPNGEEDATPLSFLTSLSLWQTVDAARSTHGVPHHDFAQYSVYCRARLKRLRHAQPVRSLLVHNAKYVHGVSGKKHAYCARNEMFSEKDKSDEDEAEKEVTEKEDSDDEEDAKYHHVNVLHNVLFQAERAWATACQLQEQQPSTGWSSGKTPKNPHSHVQRRLNKAQKHAEQLLQLVSRYASDCQADDDLTNIVRDECRAYVAWMTANVALEHKYYAQAYRQYQEALHLLLKLASSTSSSSPLALARADVWTTQAETVIRPLVRFCQYEAKDVDLLADNKDESKASAAKSKSTSPTSIVVHFRGRDIVLDPYKPLCVLYLKMEPLLQATTDESTGGSNSSMLQDESRFLQLLTDLDDALHWCVTETGHYAALPAGPAVTAKRQELELLQGYFEYHKLLVWSHQQEARIVVQVSSSLAVGDDDEHAGARVHAYDALLQNAQRMAALFSSFGDDDFEEDPLYLEAQANILRVRAFRCFYLATLYESTLDGTPQEVLALLKQATKLSKQAQEEIAACDMEQADAYLEALEELSSRIQVSQCRAEAKCYLEANADQGGGNIGMKSTDRPLWLHLHDLDAGPTLADDPPLPIPVPCKPAFYDVAWKYVGGDDFASMQVLEDYLEAEKKKSSGLFSWFSSK